jgi:D-arabinose 1-dehydrogenase-like Zn-dependent alcohol dehydrogenase
MSLVISRSKAKEAEAKAMGAKAIIPSGDEKAMKEAAGAQRVAFTWEKKECGSSSTNGCCTDSNTYMLKIQSENVQQHSSLLQGAICLARSCFLEMCFLCSSLPCRHPH